MAKGMGALKVEGGVKDSMPMKKGKSKMKAASKKSKKK